MSDYNSVDVIREANADRRRRGQSSTSFIPPLGREKAKGLNIESPQSNHFQSRRRRRRSGKRRLPRQKTGDQKIMGLPQRKNVAKLFRAGRKDKTALLRNFRSTPRSLSTASAAIAASCFHRASLTEKFRAGSLIDYSFTRSSRVRRKRTRLWSGFRPLRRDGLRPPAIGRPRTLSGQIPAPERPDAEVERPATGTPGPTNALSLQTNQERALPQSSARFCFALGPRSSNACCD